MAKDASFDVVSEVDMQEVNNAVNQAIKEITQRYDFKGSKSAITIEGESVKLLTEDDMRLKAMIDVLQTKFVRRGVAVGNMEYGKVENAANSMIRQTIKIRQGIEADVSKKITKDIKEHKFKVQTQLQDDQIRVTGKKLDDLQEVMALLRSKDYGVELQFTNFRS